MVNKLAKRLTNSVAVSNYYQLQAKQSGRAAHETDLFHNLQRLNRTWYDSNTRLIPNDALIQTPANYEQKLRLSATLNDDELNALITLRQDYTTWVGNSRYTAAPAARTVWTTWRFRSLVRFACGDYKHLPYTTLDLLVYLPTFLNHFVHVDPSDPTRIRYFKSIEHAEQDRHTSTTLARYLTEHYSCLYSAPEIRDIGTAHIAKKQRIDIQILTNTEDIENAYIVGPRSCMAYHHNHYSHNIHPVSVYGDDSDLALAIIKKSGVITARALIWPDRKVHGRLYGDHTRLQNALNELGYSHGSFAGAKLNWVTRSAESTRIDLAMPYIDAYVHNVTASACGAASVCVNQTRGTIRIVSNDYEPSSDDRVYLADSTSGGLVLRKLHNCDHCGNAVEEVTAVNEQALCDDCLDSLYTRAYNELTLRTEYVQVTSAVSWDIYNNRACVPSSTNSNFTELTHPHYNTLLFILAQQHGIQLLNIVAPTDSVQYVDGHAAYQDDVATTTAVVINGITIPEQTYVGVRSATTSILLWVIDGIHLTQHTLPLSALYVIIGLGAQRQRDNIYRLVVTAQENAA